MPDRWRKALAWSAVLAVLVLVQHWVAARRPPPPELRATREFLVTSAADDGTGSLREAIFAAAGAAGRARIRLPAGRILVQSPLPPVVNADGVLIEGVAGSTEIDGSGLASGPVLDIDAPGSLVSGVRITNAREQGIVARKDGLRVARSGFVNCDQGLYVADGVSGLAVDGSTFSQNRVGVWLAGVRGDNDVRNSRFLRHGDAAIWVVRRQVEAPAGRVLVSRSQFEQDRISLVLANTPVEVENNDFVGARDAAIVLLGQGAVVRRNRIRQGTGVGLIADDTDGVVIDGNEVDHNQAIGILVRSSGDALVRSNRLHANGYGLAFVFGRGRTPNVGAENTILRHTYDGVITIGDSPVLRDNAVLNGSLAGLRILDFYSATGARIASDPLLQRNRVEGNALNTAVRGEYRTPARPGSPR